MFFFFSSRRRHTRCSRDWSSDVCSSDLESFVPLHARCADQVLLRQFEAPPPGGRHRHWHALRSEEHTSELQSRLHLVCRLLLEKKKNFAGLARCCINYSDLIMHSSTYAA